MSAVPFNDPGNAAMERKLRMTATAEVTAMAAVVMSYIWIWQETFPGDVLVVTLMYFGIGVLGHRLRGESLRHLGFRLDNLQPAARNVSIIIAIGVGLFSSRCSIFQTDFSWP